MSYVAVGVGGVAVAGLATSVVGGIQAAGAARKAAQAQQAAAEEYKRYVQGQETKATNLVLNPAALAANDAALGAQTREVQRQQSLADSLSPMLVDAGKQAMSLLQGHSAPVLQNIQDQRAKQREQLQNQLTQQMGPGGASSSAGLQALQKFDLDTSNIMSQTQQQYLDKMSSLSLGGTQTLGESLSKADATLGQLNASSPQARAAEIIAQITGAGAGAQQAVVNAAGGQFKGDQLMGQVISQTGGQLMQGAALIGAAGIKANPTTPGTTPPGQTPGGAPSINQARMQPSIDGGGIPGAGGLSRSIAGPVGAGMPSYGQTNPAGSFITPYAGAGEPRTLGYALSDPFRYGSGGINSSNVAGGQ